MTTNLGGRSAVVLGSGAARWAEAEVAWVVKVDWAVVGCGVEGSQLLEPLAAEREGLGLEVVVVVAVAATVAGKMEVG
jgi:hypothetical protein